ncbi:hypothetical protein OsccyDRAFT_1049 [Leptolyngbyaceae cyanobacterium JSC-12]|nr:hypothetical protein OsccyDRAFT_1049 [Leptolyngbyaceae cyanobacterium JSC-12]
METHLAPTDSPLFVDILSQAVAAFRGTSDRPRPSASAVVEALLQAEKAAKQQRLTYPLEALAGKWRLYFTTTGRATRKAGIVQGRGWYVPRFVPAYISFLPDSGKSSGTIGNQIQLGSLQFKLNGPFQYPGKKNLLGFDFTYAEFSLFGKPLYKGKFQPGKAKYAHFDQLTVSQLPFFAFFLVTDDFIAARGRGGGLAIWVRD